MIYYYKPIIDKDLVLSIDNIILDVSISRSELRDLLDTMIQNIAKGKRIEIQSWESHKPGTFRYQTLFKINEECSFWLGHGLNGRGTLIDRYRLDANPNKVGTDPNFNLIREFLVRNSRSILCRLSRFDLAIDIPVDRSQCFLVKDRRMYIERRHGEEFTQYLGSKSSQVGRVKLYNKSLEADLDYPLTRLELTLDLQTDYEQLNMPTVYCLDPKTLDADAVRVTETERFILNAILSGCGSVNDLGRKTRAKIERLLQNYVHRVVVPKEGYEKILKQLENFVTY